MTQLDIKKQFGHRLPTSILGIAVTRDSQTAYAACLDGVYQIDVSSGDAKRIATHDSYVSGVVLREEQNELISAGYDGVLKWHDLSCDEVIREIPAHQFWSWKMAISDDGRRLATSTGQYLAGGYKYEPAAETEPSVKVFDAATGELIRSLSHTPPVQSVALSPNGEFVAAGNLMGDVRVWHVADGELAGSWSTDAFTSWGIIKSHCYIGGIYDLKFAGEQFLFMTGMGPMRDPMAGNGKQTWQQIDWRQEPATLVREFRGGEGLMETLAFHPDGTAFVMAGRLRGGDFNTAIFDVESGEKLHSLNTKCRVTQALFSQDGQQLFLAGTQGQGGPKEGSFRKFGRFDVFQWAHSPT